MTLHIFTTQDENEQTLLKTQCEPVTFPLSSAIHTLIEQMKHKLLELGGVGLAAPQVGASVQVIAVYIDEFAAALRQHAHPVPLTVLINPQYQALPDAKLVEDWEGCYSVNDFMGKPKRYDRIRYTAQDENGHDVDAIAEGFFARVLQHEIDHVQGMLITDRLDATSTRGTRSEMMQARRDELNEEQKKIFDFLTR
jgi:peptide deformylase